MLQLLKDSSDLLVVRTNKNLSPAIADCKPYIHKAFTNHLSDTATYQSLSSLEAHNAISTPTSKIVKLIVDHHNEL
jgi:hypothetical protein